jgi:ectoine hydroxylase-related dioxygenase (phytanoyl-CoA dioxygenase family)
MKTMILRRQARDKNKWENKNDRFCQVAQLRDEFHAMVTLQSEGGDLSCRPKKVSEAIMTPDGTFGVDPFNPRNVEGMMDQVLVSQFWFNQFAEPRIVQAMADVLGHDLDFHNGKVRNKPPGYTAYQSWHQDLPYERHSEPGLAAALTYLDPTDFEAGATEVR